MLLYLVQQIVMQLIKPGQYLLVTRLLKTGLDNCIYLTALRQPEKDLPRWPTPAKICLNIGTIAMSYADICYKPF